MPALDLNIAREKTRLSIHAAFGLQNHDLLGNFLGVVGFVRGDFYPPERKQHFRFARRVGGDLQIFAEGAFRFIKILQLGSRIAEVKPKVGFYGRGIVDLAQNAQIFLGRRINHRPRL